MMILNTLEYDGLIDRVDQDGEDHFRQALLAMPEAPALTSIPCGVCPVRLGFGSPFLVLASVAK